MWRPTAPRASQRLAPTRNADRHRVGAWHCHAHLTRAQGRGRRAEMLTISADRLTKVASDIFRAAGATEENTDCVVSALVGANLAGHDSHGILRIPAYVADIKRGRLDPKATPEVVQETGATATIDGGSTFGQVGARASADLAIAKAKDNGLAAVTAMHCHHTGRIGEWVERVAAAGLVGFATTAGPYGPYSVVPFGGAEGGLGTNPLAWAFP